MVELVIFDLDGVLLDAKTIHFEALNKALEEVDPKYTISYEEHIMKYDGLPTKTKLLKLAAEKGLPEDKFDFIFHAKQSYTRSGFRSIAKSTKLQDIFRFLLSRNVLVAVASNSIRETVQIALTSLGLTEYVDYIFSNEDVKSPKPSPEMYLRCMIAAEATPSKTLIFEDSQVGRQAALASGAILCPIRNPDDLTLEKVKEYLSNVNYSQKKWHDDDLNVLIPMAGAGSRFEQAGYTFPKPLIEVFKDPMIKVVVDNIACKAHHIFIVQEEHYNRYNLQYLLNLIAPDCSIVKINGLTEGAAVTVLKALDLIDNDKPLLIANSDQWVEWDVDRFMYEMYESNVDAGIVTFNATHPKWSFVRLDENGYVTEVAEKKPISDIATVGIYFWRKGSDFVKYAKQMIEKDIRVNGEFYVCPVFNEAIADGKKIITHKAYKMYGLGTPEDLDVFLSEMGNK